MMLTTIMPTMTPLLGLKRSRFDDCDFDDLPNSKRHHLYSQANHTENGIVLRSQQYGHLPNRKQSNLGRRSASIKAQLRMSIFFNEESSQSQSLSNGLPLTTHVLKGGSKSGDCQKVDSVTPEAFIHRNDNKMDDKIPVVNLKTNGVMMSKSLVVDNFSTSTSDADSDCSESSRTSIPTNKLKQPAIVLMKMSQPVKKQATPRPVQPDSSSVVFGGYVHRMASLNARACVSAFLEKETKFTPKCFLKPKVKDFDSKPKMPQVKSQEPVLKDDVIKFESELTGLPSTNSDSNEKKQEISEEEISYNKEGLLYNGDTLHPSARVFLTGIRELKLPTKVLPQIVPARLSTLKRAIQRAISTGIVHVAKKQRKKNNGWHPLGEPIKVIEYCEGASKKKCRKYYAGIRRKKEDIFVRDCVVIKSDPDSDEKPYVAKIGSIWQEADGSLMVTTFWYYRADDVKLQNPTVKCVGRELLASQHHDINSVACIEEKCYVIGYSQYCRYHASVVRSTILNPFRSTASGSLVPELPQPQPVVSDDFKSMDMKEDDFNLVELDPLKQQEEELGPSLQELQTIDPFLVYLCYRGFNHISGKVHGGKHMKF